MGNIRMELSNPIITSCQVNSILPKEKKEGRRCQLETDAQSPLFPLSGRQVLSEGPTKDNSLDIYHETLPRSL